MKNWIKLLLIFGIVIFHLLSINFFASLISYSYVPPKQINQYSGADVEISVSESLSVQVTRAKKWWGRTYENNGNSYLHIFDLIILPKKIKNYNFIWFHLIFLITIILLSVLMFKNYKEVKHEKLYENSNNSGNFDTSIHY